MATDLLMIFQAVPANLPEQMVLDTNFDALEYDYDTGLLTINITTPPTSGDTIVGYDLVITVNGVSRTIEIAADATFPLDFLFTSQTNPNIFTQFVTPVWDINYTFAAKTAIADGPASDQETLTLVDHTIDDDDWDAEIERDPTDSEGVAGRIRITTQSGIVVSPKVRLFQYGGLVPVVPGYFPVVVAAMGEIDADDEYFSPAAIGAVGDTYYAALMGREIASNIVFRISETVKTGIIEDILDAALPEMTVAPAVTGDGTIGVEHSVTDGTWNGSPTIGRQWLANEGAIGGEVFTTYTPDGSIDQSQLRVRVTATNAGGSVVYYTTPPLTVHYAAPTASGTISDQNLTQESGGSLTLDVSGYFAGGAAGQYSVSGHSAITINMDTGVLSMSVNAVVSSTTITVTKTNSGGSAQQQFSFSVASSSPGITWPSSPDSAEIISKIVAHEITDPTEAANAGYTGQSGHFSFAITALDTDPAGFTLRLDTRGDGPSTALVAVTDNTSYTYVTAGTAPVGSTKTPALYWRHTATDTFKLAATLASIDVIGLQQTPTSDLPLLGQTEINYAIGRNLQQWNGIGAANAVTPFDGPKMLVLAYSSFTGNTTSDARLLQQIRNVITAGREPGSGGGYMCQHDCNFIAAIAITKQVSRVWDQLTSTEKSRADFICKALTAGAAYESSINNSDIQAGTGRIACMFGAEHYWKTGNPNFRVAPLVTMLCARLYFGSASSVLAFLQAYDHATFVSSANSGNYPTIYSAFRQDTAPFDPTFSRPGNTKINNAMRNWAFAVSGASPIQLTDTAGAFNFLIDLVFNRTIASGLNNGAGVVVNGVARGKIITGAPVPNIGLSGMINELATTDGEGLRSAMSYTMLDMRLYLIAAIMNMVAAWLPYSDTNFQTRYAKVGRGMDDFWYKSDNGYRSYAHGGTGTNNEDWTQANSETLWAWPYTRALWEDVIDLWLAGS